MITRQHVFFNTLIRPLTELLEIILSPRVGRQNEGQAKEMPQPAKVKEQARVNRTIHRFTENGEILRWIGIERWLFLSIHSMPQMPCADGGG